MYYLAENKIKIEKFAFFVFCIYRFKNYSLK